MTTDIVMQVGRIEGCTRVLGKSQGYLGLPVRDEQYEDGTPCMTSAWLPSTKDIEAIKNGAPIYLRVMGGVHPPVCLFVGKEPDK